MKNRIRPLLPLSARLQLPWARTMPEVPAEMSKKSTTHSDSLLLSLFLFEALPLERREHAFEPKSRHCPSALRPCSAIASYFHSLDIERLWGNRRDAKLLRVK